MTFPFDSIDFEFPFMVGNPDDIDSTLFLAKDQFSSLATPESISGLGDGGSVIAPSCVLGLPEEGGSFHANNDEYAGKVRLKENAVEARPLPMKRGNNRLGKKGMPRCEQCRNWKIKCEYENVESHCTSCLKKLLPCGPKVFARAWRTKGKGGRPSAELGLFTLQTTRVAILRGLPPSDEEFLTPMEEAHIHGVCRGMFLFAFVLLQECRSDRRRLHGALLRRFGTTITSKPVRFGCIVYTMFKDGNAKAENPFHAQYLGYFYKAMMEAIDKEKYADIAYGCFTACMYNLKVGSPFEEIVGPANAFRVSALRLCNSESPLIDPEETFLLECMWEKLIWHMCRQLIFKSIPTRDCLNQIIEFSQPLLLSDYNDRYPLWIQSSFVDLSIKFGFIRLSAYLELCGTPECHTLKSSIAALFLGRWKQEVILEQATAIPLSRRIVFRDILQTLWFNLISLLLEIIFNGPAPQPGSVSDVILDIMSTIESTVDKVPLPEGLASLSFELCRVIKLSIYCVVLLGMVLSKAQVESSSISLTSVREKLAAIVNNRWISSPGLLSDFDEACFVLSVQAITGVEQEGFSRVLAQWIELCDRWMTVIGSDRMRGIVKPTPNQYL